MSLGFSSSLVPTLCPVIFLPMKIGIQKWIDASCGQCEEIRCSYQPPLDAHKKRLDSDNTWRIMWPVLCVFPLCRRFHEEIKPKSDAGSKLTIILTRLIDENINRNFDLWDKLKPRGMNWARSWWSTDAKRNDRPEIHNMKHALISYMDTPLGYAWCSKFAEHGMRINDWQP